MYIQTRAIYLHTYEWTPVKVHYGGNNILRFAFIHTRILSPINYL